MQTTVETTAPHTVKLTVEVPTDEFGKDLDRTYQGDRESIEPRLRVQANHRHPGRARRGPRGVRELVVPTYFRQAVSGEDLAPAPTPTSRSSSSAREQPFIFSAATVEVRPRLVRRSARIST